MNNLPKLVTIAALCLISLAWLVAACDPSNEGSPTATVTQAPSLTPLPPSPAPSATATIHPIFQTATIQASRTWTPYATPTIEDHGTPSPTPAITATPQPTPTAPAPSDIEIMRVAAWVTDGLRLRACASTACDVLALVPAGTVLALTLERVVVDGITWREVDATGEWAAEVIVGQRPFLEPYSAGGAGFPSDPDNPDYENQSRVLVAFLTLHSAPDLNAPVVARVERDDFVQWYESDGPSQLFEYTWFHVRRIRRDGGAWLNVCDPGCPWVTAWYYRPEGHQEYIGGN